MTESTVAPGWDHTEELDMRGARCPAPIIALGRFLRTAAESRVVLLADDPAAEYDVPAWCRMVGATLISAELHKDLSAPYTRYRIELPDEPHTGVKRSTHGKR